LRLWGIGDRAKRVDDLRAFLVVLKRIERPLRLIGRQHIGVFRGRGCCLRPSAGLSGDGQGKQRADDHDRREQFERHEGPFECVHDRKLESDISLRACVMSDRPFSPLSCVESLLLWRRSLGICRISKMPQDQSSAKLKLLHKW
jgi:hypothetical protein